MVYEMDKKSVTFWNRAARFIFIVAGLVCLGISGWFMFFVAPLNLYGFGLFLIAGLLFFGVGITGKASDLIHFLPFP